MKLCQFETGDGVVRVGAEVDGVIVDLAGVQSRVGKANGYAIPASLQRIVEDGPEALASLRAAVDACKRDASLRQETSLAFDPASVRILAPVSRPPKFFSIAINGGANWRNADKPANPNPHYFVKLHSCIVGPNDTVEIPDVGQVGPEVELALVLGKGGKNIPQERALEHVFGYMTHNDITAHEMRRTTEWINMHRPDGSQERLTYPGRYKNYDTFSPMGPWLVTPEDVPDPNALRLKAWLNGDLCQDGTNADHIYSIERLISYLSEAHTLEAGDIISTGTVPAAPPWTMATIDLGKIGGTISAEVEGLGRQDNPIKFLGKSA